MFHHDIIVLCTSHQSTGTYTYAGRVAIQFHSGALVQMKQGGYMCFEYANMRRATPAEREAILADWNAPIYVDKDALDDLRYQLTQNEGMDFK